MAYHLGELGFKDVILVTRDTLGSGTTYYNTGIVGISRLSTSETTFSKYSANLYEKLHKEGFDLSTTLISSFLFCSSQLVIFVYYTQIMKRLAA